MKKKKDTALEYMLELGILPAKTPGGAREQLEKVVDPEIFRELLSGEESEGALPAFYKLKNQNLRTALTVSGAFGGDVLRKACSLIDAGPSLFAEGDGAGTEILEIGCDCGIVSCFLARRFPAASVTGTDLCAEGIAAARELAEKLSLKNVAFVTAEPQAGAPAEAVPEKQEKQEEKEKQEEQEKQEVSAAGNPASGQAPDGCRGAAEYPQYDIVFSLRTMHENCAVDEDPEQAPAEYRLLCEHALKGYAAQIADSLKPGGRLVCIERYGSLFFPENGAEQTWERDALFLAYLTALREAGLEAETESIRDLKCMEAGQENLFHVMTAVRK